MVVVLEGVYLNLGVMNKSCLVLSGSKVPREMKHDFQAEIDDILALSQSFLL